MSQCVTSTSSLQLSHAVCDISHQQTKHMPLNVLCRTTFHDMHDKVVHNIKNLYAPLKAEVEVNDMSYI